ncbi:SMP-30/gluconolactonase/LRE family protein [Leifsonia sp. fls2-241-R2A-40a]|uniref:SMP-30/gluconolactonase/LRE family protein n=1 Tax=Leifsonia sp. fls2-241-R2A-40a TaxID=3040290 RepID=UPI00254F43CA|nr:SMP-30/gluconolactonase/LRE family protein [Leifsonia sp. fls2-241-R2A-40a]
MKAEQLTAPLCEHGEGPAWSDRWAGPRWVDMLAGDLLELQPDGSVRRRRAGDVAAMTRPRRGGGWVVADRARLRATTADDLEAPLQAGPELWADASIRSNEGTCAPDGTLLLGTMDNDAAEGRGFLAAVEGDSIHTVCPATISNGLGFAPDGSAFYIDSTLRRVDRFDWDPVHGLTGRRPWVDVSHAPGIPDGLAVAADGGVWVAFFGGGTVRRYGPDGREDAVVPVPVLQPTAVAFVGAGELAGSLVATTSRYALGSAAEKSAGALFVIPGAGEGAPVHEWSGELR